MLFFVQLFNFAGTSCSDFFCQDNSLIILPAYVLL